jgi:Inner membrane component domain
MSATSFLFNLLWIVFGGLWMAVGWVIAAIVMAITIVGLPWTRAAFSIASYTLLPFGQKAVSRAKYTARQDIGTGPLGVLGNVLWLVLAGWWLALAQRARCRERLDPRDLGFLAQTHVGLWHRLDVSRSGPGRKADVPNQRV